MVGGKLGRRPADDLALQRLDPISSEKGRFRSLTVIAAGGWIVDDGTAQRLAPGRVLFWAAFRSEIGLGEQAARVGAHEQWAVRPVAHKFAIVPAALEHDLRD